MLKIIRTTLSILSIVAVTLLFVDFTGTARSLWPWMAKVQLVPAILSGSVIAVVAILLATLLFGRIYCSIICPLGIFQDVVNWVRGHVGKRRSRINRFRFSPAATRLRLGVFTGFAALLIAGLFGLLATSIAGLLDPYSAFGRIASQIFAPAYYGCNNLLAAWSESRADNYMFYRVSAMITIPVLVVAIITLMVVVVMAWRGGRDYCNKICPVGTFLGFISRHSIFRITIDTSKCINCGKCARNCKSKCIDAKHHVIDCSRCVVCLDCVGHCSEGAIKYTLRGKAPLTHPTDTTDKGRRGFVAGAGFLVGAIAMEAVAKTTDGGLTALKPKQPAKRDTKAVPAGAVSLAHLKSHCTACQLCIQACPNNVLKPSTDFDDFMQPHIDFTDGFCRIDCTRCADICPNGAIKPIDVALKSSTKIGTAVVNPDTCISASDGKRCGNCASRCPVGAIVMVHRNPHDSQSNMIPAVDESACIGCGSCEYHCPVGTVEGMEASWSAIHVEGVEVHREV